MAHMDGRRSHALPATPEERFAGGGSTPKGRRARLAIFNATRQTIAELGVEHSSLDMIASRAGLTQAALRHHFPTRDELLTSYFVAGTEWLRELVAHALAAERLTPEATLRRCISTHLEYMEEMDTVFWLEASAYWIRSKTRRKTRDTFYAWLTGQYASLIREMRPALRHAECERHAFEILTLVLGAWITHGRGSTIRSRTAARERREWLIEAALAIARR